MKKLLFIVPALFMFSSCKKNFSCTCNTQYSTQYGGNVNQSQYNVKEYDESAAQNSCTKMYQEGHPNVASGSFTCSVI